MKTNKESLDKFIDKAMFYGGLAWLEESYNAPLWRRIQLWFKYRWGKKISKGERQMKKTLESEYTIVSKPIYITFKCPNCGERVVINVDKLESTNVWESGYEDCPYCHKGIHLTWNGVYD